VRARAAARGARSAPGSDRARWIAAAIAAAIRHRNRSRPVDDPIHSTRLRGMALPQ